MAEQLEELEFYKQELDERTEKIAELETKLDESIKNFDSFLLCIESLQWTEFEDYFKAVKIEDINDILKEYGGNQLG
jgi:hypothetical protein